MKNIDWTTIREYNLIFVLPLFLFGVPILWFGAAPISAWLVVAGVVALFEFFIFWVERLER